MAAITASSICTSKEYSYDLKTSTEVTSCAYSSKSLSSVDLRDEEWSVAEPREFTVWDVRRAVEKHCVEYRYLGSFSSRTLTTCRFPRQETPMLDAAWRVGEFSVAVFRELVEFSEPKRTAGQSILDSLAQFFRE